MLRVPLIHLKNKRIDDRKYTMSSAESEDVLRLAEVVAHFPEDVLRKGNRCLDMSNSIVC